MQLASKIDNLIERKFFCAELNKIDISLQHRLGCAFSFSDADVTEIDNTVEPAIA